MTHILNTTIRIDIGGEKPFHLDLREVTDWIDEYVDEHDMLAEWNSYRRDYIEPYYKGEEAYDPVFQGDFHADVLHHILMEDTNDVIDRIDLPTDAEDALREYIKDAI